ncbi:S8 family serine peptidase [Desulfosporosinus sp. BICA1-9]|uniref:S8 family serine peptidase n=1 Tax=Desulfosporosinus sp. BICA1-9 TaxID=1531958 RepID=UPI000A87E3AF|nr:S8 family serine peptidase [Desulfosporosinus sp. BICA1-9]HBW34085.1 serine protease [Desulfosporosinus sp.]
MKNRLIIFVLVLITLTFPIRNTAASSLPISPREAEEWGLQAVEAPKVWSMGITGKGINVAVVDTGVNASIGDLKGNLILGYNALTKGTSFVDTVDDNGHGTQVASLIAGNGQGLGLFGVAPEAKILPVKVFDSSGNGEVQSVQSGIRWAADHGAKIINLSMGSSTLDAPLQEAVKYAQAKDCLIVAAAGNHLYTEEPNILYPASLPGVVAVGAMTKNYKIASFSKTGSNLDFIAPGTDILTDVVGISGVNKLILDEGTSMAAPFVSGVAALIWSAHPDWSAQQVASNIKQSAQRLDVSGRSSQFGFGLPNAYRAVKIADLQTLTDPEIIDFAGALIKDTSSGASLLVSPLTWNSTGSVNLQPADVPAPFPSGIIPGSEMVRVSWETSEIPHKILSLSIPVTEHSTLANYLFRWNGSRWIRVAGGVTGSMLKVGIFEQGIYRIGQMPLTTSLHLNGDDRIATAIQVADSAYPTGADTVILARADDYSDALAGVPLAYKYSAPILLTYPDSLDSRVMAAIQHLSPKSIYLLGGTGAISSGIELDLSQISSVYRLAGANRYATAAQIALTLGTIGKAVIVSGENFPDALSIASIAAERGEPILLTDNDDSVPLETLNALNTLWVTDTLVVGGSAVVSSAALEQLPGPVRLAGVDRYATNQMVIDAFPSAGKLITVASGEDFPDALTGSVLATVNNSILYLINTGTSMPSGAIMIGRDPGADRNE